MVKDLVLNSNHVELSRGLTIREAVITHARLQKRLHSKLGLKSLAVVWCHPRVSSLLIVVNPRLRTTLARWKPPGDVIQVNPAALKRGPKKLREIVCHEAAHVVVWDRHGRKARPHGPEWKQLMRAAGFEPQAVLMRCVPPKHRKAHGLRFRHFCSVCHFERIGKKRVANWRCPECRAIGLSGRLRVEQIFPAPVPNFR